VACKTFAGCAEAVTEVPMVCMGELIVRAGFMAEAAMRVEAALVASTTLTEPLLDVVGNE